MEANQGEKKRWSRPTLPLLSLALAVSLVWGYTQYRARRSWEIRAENTYTKSFSELSTHVGDLETQLAKSMASDSSKKLMERFNDIWRQAYHAQEDLGQLPLASVELGRTKDFLAKAAAFSYSMAGHIMKGEGLTEEKRQTLSDLHRQAKYLVSELRNLQGSVLEKKERWLPVDRISLSFAAADVSERLNTNKITKSFMMMEDGFRRLPDPEIEGNLLNFKPVAKGLTGPNLNVEEAREKALGFLDQDGKGYRAKYEGQIKGDYPVYMFRLTEETDEKQKEGSGVRVGVSVKGGHPLWMLKERAVSHSGLSLQEAGEKARSFLAQRGFPQMTPVALEEAENVAIVSLASKRDDILIYPEMVKAEVALDNGEVLGVEAAPYFTFHDPERKISPPRLSAAEARKKVSPYLKVEDTTKAVILNDLFQEVLCYESKGALGEDRFLVYINASTGEEEKIKRIDKYGAELE